MKSTLRGRRELNSELQTQRRMLRQLAKENVELQEEANQLRAAVNIFRELATARRRHILDTASSVCLQEANRNTRRSAA